MGKLRAKVEALLESEPDDEALLRQLGQWTTRKPAKLGRLFPLWGPALYKRDWSLLAHFYNTHATNFKRVRGHDAGEALPFLHQVEADGHEELFVALLHSFGPWTLWNQPLLELLHAYPSDEALHQALMRRETGVNRLDFSDEIAVLLYERNPSLFGPLLQRHSHPNSPHPFLRLRECARRQRDDELYWHLFRIKAHPAEWRKALEELLEQNPPPEQVLAELERRHPAHYRYVGAEMVLLKFLARYRKVVWPYITQGMWLLCMARADRKRLLLTVRRLRDRAIYLETLYQIEAIDEWNAELRALLQEPLKDEELFGFLEQTVPPSLRAPVADGWVRYRWWLADDVATALYNRNPGRAAPFLSMFPYGDLRGLYQAANARGDELLLDRLTLHLVFFITHIQGQLQSTVRNAAWQELLPEREEHLVALPPLAIARFERLYDQDPTLYLRHTFALLDEAERRDGYWRWPHWQENPILAYLLVAHRECWQQSSFYIRELLESPAHSLQSFALVILQESNPDSAARVVENLPLLRALLLSRNRRNFKKRVLAVLEGAARQGPAYAQAILPLLEEAMAFRGKRAIAERAMVSFVRLRREQKKHEAV